MRKLDQSDRQDLKHVRMLCYCVHGYLKFRLNQLRHREITPRDCIDSLEATLSVVVSSNAKHVGNEFSIDFSNVFPKKELKRQRASPIKNFVNMRLPSRGFFI